MRELMAADSPLHRLLSRMADLMILNLLFVVASLPVVTLGASLTALHATALRMVDGSPESVPDLFLRSFRANLRQATLLLGIAAGAVAVLAAWVIVAVNLQVRGVWVVLALAVVVMIGLRVLATLLFLFPYQATFEGGVREVVGNARRMSARHPLASLAMAAVLALPVAVTITNPVLAGYGLLWLLFGFAAIACLHALLLRGVFARYIPRDPA